MNARKPEQQPSRPTPHGSGDRNTMSDGNWEAIETKPAEQSQTSAKPPPPPDYKLPGEDVGRNEASGVD